MWKYCIIIYFKIIWKLTLRPLALLMALRGRSTLNTRRIFTTDILPDLEMYYLLTLVTKYKSRVTTSLPEYLPMYHEDSRTIPSLHERHFFNTIASYLLNRWHVTLFLFTFTLLRRFYFILLHGFKIIKNVDIYHLN